MEEEIRRSGWERREEEEPIEEEQRDGIDRRIVVNDSENLIGYIKKIPIFYGLTYDELTMVLSICSKKIIPENHVLFREGDDSNELFIILQGEFDVIYGKDTRIACITPLGMVGEMGVFNDMRRSATVVAVAESTVLKMTKVELFELFRHHCALSNRILLNVIRDLTNKLHEENEVIEELRKKQRSKIL